MLFTSTRYPHDYGFVDNTLGEDGDPSTRSFCSRSRRSPGASSDAARSGCSATDEAGGDDKLICVPVADPASSTCATSTTWLSSTASEVQHFFEVYKDLEPGKSRRGRDLGRPRAAERGARLAGTLPGGGTRRGQRAGADGPGRGA